MSFLRFVSRSLLASYFLADGLGAVLNPGPRLDAAQGATEALTQCAQRHLPSELTVYIPTRPETFVRLHGTVQAVGALMLATGLGRRPGAILVAAAYLPKALAARRQLRDPLLFAKEITLFGAALLAVQDTEGKPNLAWHAAKKRQAAKEAKAAKAASQVSA